jgi:transformation/transcription domain-associated protein
MKAAFLNDFIKAKPNHAQYVAKLRTWRDKFEAMLDSRSRKQKLESASHYLIEFQHQKFDDVEIPGQYLLVSFNYEYVWQYHNLLKNLGSTAQR